MPISKQANGTQKKPMITILLYYANIALLKLKLNKIRHDMSPSIGNEMFACPANPGRHWYYYSLQHYFTYYEVHPVVPEPQLQHD